MDSAVLVYWRLIRMSTELGVDATHSSRLDADQLFTHL
jgi:hypothetical protein